MIASSLSFTQAWQMMEDCPVNLLQGPECAAEDFDKHVIKSKACSMLIK